MTSDLETVAHALPAVQRVSRLGAFTPSLSWLGPLGVLAVWQIIGVLNPRQSGVVPAPTTVAQHMLHDGWSFYWPNTSATLREAAVGWALANVLAVLLGLLCVVVPWLERPILTAGVGTFCLPSVAVLPIFAIIWSGDTPKVALAFLSVFFVTLTGTVAGLRDVEQASLDLIQAFGGGAWSRLVKVRVFAALPSVFAALKIAGPSAVLGAMLGEFVGGSRGLGVAMISSEQSLDIPRTWGIACAATVLAGIVYLVTGVVGRLCTPWVVRSRTGSRHGG